MSLREKPSPATRAARLRQLRGRLAQNETNRQKLLDERDRLIVEAFDAGDERTKLAEDAGLDRRSIYVIHDQGRDRKGAISD